MGYRWLVFAHLAGVFGFLAAHGVSMAVSLRLRSERDVNRINGMLDVSSRTIGVLYASLGLLLAGGVGATFAGGLWSFGWIWAALALLVLVTLAMIFMAKPYYRKVRFLSRAIAEGSQAVSPEQFDSVLRSGRPMTIMGIGFVGLALILGLMIFKPTLGIAPKRIAVVVPPGPSITLTARGSVFEEKSLTAPAGVAFSIVFDNQDSGVPHNVSVFADATAARSIFSGALFPGPAERLYKLPALDAGSYFFRCDAHPSDMTGTLEVQ